MNFQKSISFRLHLKEIEILIHLEINKFGTSVNKKLSYYKFDLDISKVSIAEKTSLTFSTNYKNINEKLTEMERNMHRLEQDSRTTYERLTRRTRFINF